MEGMMPVPRNLTLRIFRSPFSTALHQEISVPIESGLTLATLRDRYLPASDELHFAISINMIMVRPEVYDRAYPAHGNVISCIPCPGKDAGQFLGLAVAIMAIAVSGGALGPAGLGLLGPAFAAGHMGAILGGLAISVLGGLAVSALVGQDIPSIDYTGYDKSTAYSWSPQNTQQQGTAIPRAYGTHRIYGNIISAFIENVNDKLYINILVDCGIFRAKRLYDFKINDQPAENFQCVEIHSRLGDLDQEPIPFFNDTKTEYAASVKITKGTPYIYRTIGADFDGLEIDITFASLFHSNDSGGLDSVSVDLRIEIQKDNDAWEAITEQCVETAGPVVDVDRWSAGKYIPVFNPWPVEGDDPAGAWRELAAGSTDPYEHYDGESFCDEAGKVLGWWRWRTEAYKTTVSETVDYLTVSGAQTSPVRRTVRVDNLTHGARNIRITRLTDEYTGSRYGADMYLTTVREIYADDFEHPRHTMYAIRALASDQLSGSLRASCLCEAAIVNVYENGAWERKHSNNNAWIGFDMATQPVLDNNLDIVRYDSLDPSDVDIPKHIELAARCNEQVPDGKGGLENLFEFDGIFDATTSLWDALIRVYKTARAIPYWQGMMLTLAINQPRASRHTLTMGSIVRGNFSGQWSSAQQRASELRIEFANKEKDYTKTPMPVYHPLNKTYQQPLNMDMFGVVRPSQITRDGFFMLTCNRELTHSISLISPVNMIEATLGDVLDVAHDMPGWRKSGRLQGVIDDDTVILDREVALEAGVTYTLYIKHVTDVIIVRTILEAVDESTLKVAVPFDPGLLPQAYEEYHFGKIGEVTKPFSILSIKPTVKDNDINFALTMLEYNETVFNPDYGQPVIPTPNYSTPQAVGGVTGPHSHVSIVDTGVGFVRMVELFFNLPIAAASVAVDIYMSVDGRTWKFMGATPAGYIKLRDVPEGVITFAFVVSSADGKQSIAAAARLTVDTRIEHQTVPPVTSIYVSVAGNGLSIAWTEPEDYGYVDYYEIWLKGADKQYHLKNTVKGTRIDVDVLDWSAAEFMVRIITVSIFKNRSDPAECVFAPSGTGPGTPTGPLKYNLRGSIVNNIVSLTWTPLVDPAISTYEIRKGAKGGMVDNAMFVGTSTIGLIEDILNQSLPVYYVLAKYTNGNYSVYSDRLDFNALQTPTGLKLTVTEPNIQSTWARVAGAARYRVLIESGGLTSGNYVTDPSYLFAIPKFNTLVRVQAWSNEGYFSSWIEEEISVTGIYNYNEILNFSMPSFTGGTFVNMAFINATKVQRPSLIGGTVAAPYASGVNDSDLFNFARGIKDIVANDIASTPAAWFRRNWWLPKEGYFESPVYDLGDVYSGKLNVTLTKTITNYSNALSQWSWMLAKYIKDLTIEELKDNRAHVSADIFISADGFTWASAANNNWISAVRYVKFAASVIYASPLTEINIEVGKVYIDVPDLTDSGSITLAGGATSGNVVFTKQFHAIPFVLCNAAGNAKAWPTAASIAGFTANSDVAGSTITWFAKKY